MPVNVSGIDTTSCQAERNFSAHKLVVSDLRSRMSSVRRVEQTVFLRKKNLIPGLNKELLSLQGLKEERKANADAAKNSVSGDRSVHLFPSLNNDKQRIRSVCVLRFALSLIHI